MLRGLWNAALSLQSLQLLRLEHIAVRRLRATEAHTRSIGRRGPATTLTLERVLALQCRCRCRCISTWPDSSRRVQAASLVLLVLTRIIRTHALQQ